MFEQTIVFVVLILMNYHVMWYLGSVLAQRTYYFLTKTPISTDQWREKIGCFINCIASNLFFCSYNARIPFKNLLPVLSFLLTVLFCILLRKCSLIWIIFFSKTSSRNILSCSIVAFYVFTLIYYLLWCSSLILLIGDIKTNPGPISSSGQCLSIWNWNLQCYIKQLVFKWHN